MWISSPPAGNPSVGEEIERLKKEFGLEGEELNIDLGPLGKLL